VYRKAINSFVLYFVNLRTTRSAT